MNLTQKNILLGVTGGIAAYKAAELVRLLTKAGATVQTVMTAGAGHFITATTLQALSGREVRTDLFDPSAEASMGHIELARWADLILVAPASADFMARLKAGQANDLLTTVCLASAAPIAIAPAMNQQMWANAATVDNAASLASRGVRLWGPDEGIQACGDVGPGRMLEPAEIALRVGAFFSSKGKLRQRRVLITAGPTREAIDPVRYLSNRSSGKMGYAIAQAALEAGAEVTLISGPVSITPPAGVHLIGIESAADMHNATLIAAACADIFIATAAVADYRAQEVAGQKIKKNADELVVRLIKNPDILADVAKSNPRPFCVGFAAETHDLEHYARDKLARKNLDMIAANPVNNGLAFDRAENTLSVYWQGGEQHLPTTDKQTLATQLIDIIAARYSSKELHAPD